jgi:hypothetical protein
MISEKPFRTPAITALDKENDGWLMMRPAHGAGRACSGYIAVAAIVTYRWQAGISQCAISHRRRAIYGHQRDACWQHRSWRNQAEIPLEAVDQPEVAR